LQLAEPQAAMDLSADTRSVLDALAGWCLVFVELIRRTASCRQVEQALAELAALGFVTCDSFDGLRALLVPSDKRPTLGRNEGKRRRKTNLASIEFAGRWSLFKPETSDNGEPAHRRSRREEAHPFHHNGTQKVPQPLCRKFSAPGEGAVRGVGCCGPPARWSNMRAHYFAVTDRLSAIAGTRDFAVSWYELGRIYRRQEARGEIRGGYFVGGVSGEQFALPEAIGLLRSLRKSPGKGELITLSAADPLNLVGLVTLVRALPHSRPTEFFSATACLSQPWRPDKSTGSRTIPLPTS
jgi:ATP-dependent Lhr-like helicase